MIPVVDCGGDIVGHANEILAATETVGFVYLQNFGIPPSQVADVMEVADRFWALPQKTKMRYARQENAYMEAANTGYVPAGMETLDTATNAQEIREAYNITPGDGERMILPDDIMPEYRLKILKFFHDCHMVALQVMRALAVAMKFEDATFFDKTHEFIGSGANATTLRLLFYPPLPDKIPANSSRCGEHSDYGTVTLLFQDDVGGLEVKDRSGAFVPATPCPHAVLINTGDLLQRWTSDRLIAVRHRVLVPSDEEQRKTKRRSLAFFVHPDDDCEVSPLDGSDKYAPITARQHLINMFTKTY